MTVSTSYDDFLATAKDLAQEAHDLIGQVVGARTASRKADGSLVTRTDRAIDALLSLRITERYPGHAVLSEEQVTTYDPAIRYTWVVDPLDGTTNFARGLPVWGISIALLDQGEPIVGVVRFPSLHEEFASVKGQGATWNSELVTTAPERTIDNQHFIMCCTRTGRRYRVTTPLKTRILGSAAYHLLKVADGSALAAIEATPKIWDLAAALLILAEAGGVAQPIGRGSLPFPVPPVASDFRNQSFPLIAAANLDVLQVVSRQVAELPLK